ncbi:MAG: response regulator [Candidatus Obscuribacter sp.]|nr:response regulator [Candidatus Obscuribacter sp.]MBK9774038.1 response regulator [Candidatus Obscuribacter sp.]
MMQIERIMLIDDDASIRKIAAVTLERVGKWQVKTADGGLSGLAMAAEFKPDVILLDVMMPGMDGPATYKLLKEDPAVTNTPVIFMTAKVQGQELESYSQLGVQGVISKPFNPLTLPAEIEALVNGG